MVVPGNWIAKSGPPWRLNAIRNEDQDGPRIVHGAHNYF